LNEPEKLNLANFFDVLWQELPCLSKATNKTTGEAVVHQFNKADTCVS
jgi:hypothetical protein